MKFWLHLSFTYFVVACVFNMKDMLNNSLNLLTSQRSQLKIHLLLISIKTFDETCK